MTMSCKKPQFSCKKLRKALKEKSSCIEEVYFKSKLGILPCHLDDIKEGIREELDLLLKKNFEEYGGIILGYDLIKILSPVGIVSTKQSEIFFDVEGIFFVFKPTVGSVLDGVVVKKSDRHVGCLIHDIFNVSCPRPDGITSDKWSGAKVNENDTVTVEVCYIAFNSIIPFIKAKIIEISPNSKQHSEEEIEDCQNISESVENNYKIENDITIKEEPLEAPSKKRKKSKKESKQIKSESLDKEDEDVEIYVKKKKLKQEKIH